jgi:hypothetical protein
MSTHGAVELGVPWPSLGTAPEQENARADCEFEMEFFSPTEIRTDPRYRAQLRNMLDAPRCTTYAVLTTQTRKGPFVCVIPLDGRQAMRTKGLTQYLVKVAQEELAREWQPQVG